jgi:hypothetical protein
VVSPASLPTIDPNVKVPSAIRKQAEAANAAFHAANGTTPAPAEPAAPGATAEVIPPVTSEVTLAAPAAPQDWEHAFKSMKGRYESSQTNIRNMSEQMASMQTQLVALQSAQPAAPEMLASSLLTPEETNEYGAEFLSVVGKKALEQLSPEMAAVKKELARLQAKLDGDAVVSSANARNAMNTALDDQLPDWRQVNVAPEFHSWLQLPDPFSGAIRHSLLSAAYEQNNTPRVLAFFKGFLAHEAALAPATQGAAPDTSVVETGKIPLEAFAAPGRAKTSAAPGAPVEKPTFTAAQISKHYADSARGAYRGREVERDRIDAQIVEAGREGRIR